MLGWIVIALLGLYIGYKIGHRIGFRRGVFFGVNVFLYGCLFKGKKDISYFEGSEKYVN